MNNDYTQKNNPLEIFDRSAEEASRMDNYSSMLRQQAKMELEALRARKAEQSPQNETGDVAGYIQDGRQQNAIMPGKFALTQNYMNYNPEIEKYSGGYHTGTDFATPEGTPIALPSGKWRIVQAANGFNSGYGNSVLAENEETGEQMRFSHLSRINTTPGAAIQGGSVVGFTGNTGNSTGAHVDIEYMTKGGKKANLMNSRYARELYGNF